MDGREGVFFCCAHCQQFPYLLPLNMVHKNEKKKVLRFQEKIPSRYRLKMTCVAGPCKYTGERTPPFPSGVNCMWGPIFRVEKIGVAEAADISHGFELDESEVRKWKAENPNCQGMQANPKKHFVRSIELCGSNA